MCHKYRGGLNRSLISIVLLQKLYRLLQSWAGSKFEKTPILREERGDDSRERISSKNRVDGDDNSLYFITLLRNVMLEVERHASNGEHESDVHRGVLDTDTAMWASTPNHVVLWVGIGAAIGVEPAIGIQDVRLGEHLRIVERVVERRDEHASIWNNVVIGDRESLGGFVGNLPAYEYLHI